MENMYVKIYDGSKYDKASQMIGRIEYKDVTNFHVYNMADDEAIAQGWDEADECGEYLELRFSDGEIATFRNSRVDLFFC